MVTWSGKDAESYNTIYVQKFNVDGSTSGVPVPLYAPDAQFNNNGTPQITALGSTGEYALTWVGMDSQGDFSIFVQKFNADGSVSGETVQLEAMGNPGANDLDPQITALGSGGAFVVTWTGSDSQDDNSIFVQKFNADGTASGSPVQLEALGNTTGGDHAPQITAVGSAGAFVVTWSGQDSLGDRSIFVQKFNADGTTTGNTMVQLEALGNAAGYDADVQITAVGSMGEFVVTWQGQDSDVEQDKSIFVQKFNADGTLATSGGPVHVTASTAAEDSTVPVQSTEAGIAYLVHSSINMAGGVSALTLDNESQWNSQAIITANTTIDMDTTGLVDGDYHLYTADAAGNLSQAVNNVLEIDKAAPTYTLGQEFISLGDMGQLMRPVQVDGNWYYLWDVNGDSAISHDENTDGKYDRDGAETNLAGVGYRFDALNHSVLDALFVKDAYGVTEIASNAVGLVGKTDNTFRFAQIAGVNLALPTLGHGGTQLEGFYYAGESTSVDNSTPGEINPSFDDLFAIWDAHNGSDTGEIVISGLPGAWTDDNYWSATPTEGGFHAAIYFGAGEAFEFSALQAFTVVQVL